MDVGLQAAKDTLKRIEAFKAWLEYERGVAEPTSHSLNEKVRESMTIASSTSSSTSSSMSSAFSIGMMVGGMLLIVIVISAVVMYRLRLAKSEEVVFVGVDWSPSVHTFRGPLLNHETTS